MNTDKKKSLVLFVFIRVHTWLNMSVRSGGAVWFPGAPTLRGDILSDGRLRQPRPAV